MLTGYKTYIVGLAGLVYALLGFFLGHFDGATALQFVQVSLMGMGLRSAIN